MASYRCYLLIGAETAVKSFDSTSDRAATAVARQVFARSGGFGFELWIGNRLVRRQLQARRLAPSRGGMAARAA